MPYKDKDAHREYQRKWVADRRALFFRDKSCVECSSTYDLELDHIHPELKFTHRIWSYSWERIMKEVAKCQILCHECHMKKCAKEKERKLKVDHGFERTYRNGCRCNKCKIAHKLSERPYNERTAGTKEWAMIFHKSPQGALETAV